MPGDGQQRLCRVPHCTTPSIAMGLCVEHLVVENVAVCAIEDCHRIPARKSRYCPVHQFMDTVTSNGVPDEMAER